MYSTQELLDKRKRIEDLKTFSRIGLEYFVQAKNKSLTNSLELGSSETFLSLVFLLGRIWDAAEEAVMLQYQIDTADCPKAFTVDDWHLWKVGESLRTDGVNEYYEILMEELEKMYYAGQLDHKH